MKFVRGVILLVIALSLLPNFSVMAASPQVEPAAQKAASLLPPTIMVTIHAPFGVFTTPYVILDAFSSSTNTPPKLAIKGYYGSNAFVCDSIPCALQTDASDRIVFHAETVDGISSKEIAADVEVKKADGGYRVRILKQSGVTAYQDSCAAVWQLSDLQSPFWAYFPQDPSQLNTNKDLYNLASRLMMSGEVDTKSCPNGGWLGSGPNGCALELVRPEMTRWQNQYDLSIWMAARDNGIPPVLLKTLIEVETQYWPITRHQYMDELGLAQINQLGIDILLRNDPEFYLKSCSNVLFNCSVPYSSQPPINQQLLRGTIAKSLDAECPTCKYGINFDAAGNSIGLISKVMHANCVQTKNVLGGNLHRFTYDEAWKVTLSIYHSGTGCIQSAISAIDEENKQFDSEHQIKITWDSLASHNKCVTTPGYIDKFFTTLYNFDNNLLPEPDLTFYKPSPATPQQQGVLSTAKADVLVFMDANGDGIQQTSEAINDLPVEMQLSTGQKVTQNTKNGLVSFDLNGVPVGITATFTLPTLFRTATANVPANGILPVKFIFAAPIGQTPKP